jgi:hypothetical protein
LKKHKKALQFAKIYDIIVTTQRKNAERRVSDAYFEKDFDEFSCNPFDCGNGASNGVL